MATTAKPKQTNLKTTVDWVVPAAAVSMVFVMLVPFPASCSTFCSPSV